MSKRRFYLLPVFLVIFLILCCSGCSGEASSGTSGSYEAGRTNVLVPAADGEVTVGGDPLLLAFSHTDQGYFMGMLRTDTKVNIQVIGPDNITYKYFLETPDVYATFPLTAGNGTYIILAFENITGNQYISILSHTIDVELENEFLPFLYPNQFVNFNADNEAVALAGQLSADAETDLDAFTAVFQYVVDNISYDHEKLRTAESNYLPDVDDTLRTKTGICFDYAALTVAMLRSLSIPARLDIGYSGNAYHAWVTVYIKSIGWVEHAIEFSGDEWKLIDPTFVSTSDDKEAIMDYIGEGENYTLMFVR